MKVSDHAESMSDVVIYIIAGIGILLAILVIVWLLFKLSSFISGKKGGRNKKEELTDEEELFGD
jgi:hypothetical protein